MDRRVYIYICICTYNAIKAKASAVYFREQKNPLSQTKNRHPIRLKSLARRMNAVIHLCAYLHVSFHIRLYGVPLPVPIQYNRREQSVLEQKVNRKGKIEKGRQELVGDMEWL
jgi:hypothetical protein